MPRLLLGPFQCLVLENPVVRPQATSLLKLPLPRPLIEVREKELLRQAKQVLRGRLLPVAVVAVGRRLRVAETLLLVVGGVFARSRPLAQ